MTFPTKVLSDSLGGIGSLKRTSDKSMFPMALGGCGHRITHQLRPINVNRRSILSETSRMPLIYFFFWPEVIHLRRRGLPQPPGHVHLDHVSIPHRVPR